MRYPATSELIVAATCLILCASHGIAGEQDIRTQTVVSGTKYTIHSDILGDDRSVIVGDHAGIT